MSLFEWSDGKLGVAAMPIGARPQQAPAQPRLHQRGNPDEAPTCELR